MLIPSTGNQHFPDMIIFFYFFNVKTIPPRGIAFDGVWCSVSTYVGNDIHTLSDISIRISLNLFASSTVILF